MSSIYVVEPILLPFRLLTSPWPSVRQGYFLIFRILVFVFFVATLIVSVYRARETIVKWPFFLTHIGFLLATVYFGIVSVEMLLAVRKTVGGFLERCDQSVDELKSTFREKSKGGDRSKAYLFSLWQLCIMNIPMHIVIFIMFWGTLATERIRNKWGNDDLMIYSDVTMHGVELVILLIDFCLMKRIPVRLRHGIFLVFFLFIYFGWMCLGYYINHSAGSRNPWCYKMLAPDGPSHIVPKNYAILLIIIGTAFLSFFGLTLNHSDKENHVIPARRLLSRIAVVVIKREEEEEEEDMEFEMKKVIENL